MRLSIANKSHIDVNKLWQSQFDDISVVKSYYTQDLKSFAIDTKYTKHRVVLKFLFWRNLN